MGCINSKTEKPAPKQQHAVKQSEEVNNPFMKKRSVGNMESNNGFVTRNRKETANPQTVENRGPTSLIPSKWHSFEYLHRLQFHKSSSPVCNATN